MFRTCELCLEWASCCSWAALFGALFDPPRLHIFARTPACLSACDTAGYVEQFDVLLDSLTVEEMLMYTAELKRPQSQTRKQVDTLICGSPPLPGNPPASYLVLQ